MQDLEKGSIANPDENSMVGHYWLRKPEIAPTDEIKNKINTSIKKIKKFAAEIHQGKIKPQNSDFFQMDAGYGIPRIRIPGYLSRVRHAKSYRNQQHSGEFW